MVMLLAPSASERAGTTSPRRDLQARLPFGRGPQRDGRSELVKNSCVSVPQPAFGHEGGRLFGVPLTPLPIPLSCGMKLPCEIKDMPETLVHLEQRTCHHAVWRSGARTSEINALFFLPLSSFAYRSYR